jgi:hypothetical protein
MRQHHYLGFAGMVGESLRYVAECGGQWLALLGWQACLPAGRRRRSSAGPATAGPVCPVCRQAGDRQVGWPPVLHYQRLLSRPRVVVHKTPT